MDILIKAEITEEVFNKIPNDIKDQIKIRLIEAAGITILQEGEDNKKKRLSRLGVFRREVDSIERAFGKDSL